MLNRPTQDYANLLGFRGLSYFGPLALPPAGAVSRQE